MYNNPYDYFRQHNMNAANQNQMNYMQDMEYQQPFYNQMPTMPMQPIQPMMPMGTTPMGGAQFIPGTTSGTMPTNIGTAPITTPTNVGSTAPISMDQFGEVPVNDVLYTQGWLKTQIGQKVKIEFLIGTNMLVDREGTLLEVGISYVIINEVETDDLLLCDIYSIKFVRIYR